MTGMFVWRFKAPDLMSEVSRCETYLYGQRLAAPVVRVAPGQPCFTRCFLSSPPDVIIVTCCPIFGSVLFSSSTASMASVSKGSVQNVRQPVTERYSQSIFCDLIDDATSLQFFNSNAAISGVLSKTSGWRWPPFCSMLECHYRIFVMLGDKMFESVAANSEISCN